MQPAGGQQQEPLSGSSLSRGARTREGVLREARFEPFVSRDPSNRPPLFFSRRRLLTHQREVSAAPRGVPAPILGPRLHIHDPASPTEGEEGSGGGRPDLRPWGRLMHLLMGTGRGEASPAVVSGKKAPPPDSPLPLPHSGALSGSLEPQLLPGPGDAGGRPERISPRGRAHLQAALRAPVAVRGVLWGREPGVRRRGDAHHRPAGLGVG